MRAFLQRRIIEPLARQLTQGVTPRRLAVAVALGFVLGCLPLLGATTALCALMGVALRLNQPAVQVANYLAYPVQLAAYLPFFHLGARLFGAPAVSFTPGEVRAQLAVGVGETLARYGWANLRAVAAWALVAPIGAAALYLVLRPVLARVAGRRGT
jgi:uncharacterized protein (DUF2062 family)